jgi:hypothetical protein
MIKSATSLMAFGVVVVIVGTLGIVVALGIAIRHRDTFAASAEDSGCFTARRIRVRIRCRGRASRSDM